MHIYIHDLLITVIVTIELENVGIESDNMKMLTSSANPEDLIPFYELKERDQEDLVEEQQETTLCCPETRQNKDQDRDFQRIDKHNTIQKSMPPQNSKLFH